MRSGSLPRSTREQPAACDAHGGETIGIRPHRLSRRVLLGSGGLGLAAFAAGARPVAAHLWRPGALQEASPAAPAETLTIDLAAEPPSLDPAIVYDVDSWSVVHSLYDALVQYGPDGELEPLLAESLTLIDPLTYEIRLREGITFHNGEPLDARSVSFSVARLQAPETGSQLADTFKVIERVEEVDPLTARLKLTQPAPWLPSQMAVWLALLPPEQTAAAGDEIGVQPVGTGPYRFVAWEPGAAIELEANPEYFAGSPKGQPSARRVSFRVVPDASTRVADLLANSAHIIRSVPVDQVERVEVAGAAVIVQLLSGSAWIRIPTDVAPFDDVRVRLALNLAVDVETIVEALLAGDGQPLPNFFAAPGLGYDSALAPHPYDPDRARALLREAGYGEGFATILEYSSDEREEIATAIAGMLAEVGVEVELRPTEKATFNATWADPAAPPLRFATWRPLFDPYTLLSLVVSDQGFLSRHANPAVQALIDAAASETDEARRAELYRQLGVVLRDEPAAIYLYSLTERYGVAADAPAWTPRADDYIIPVTR